MITRAEIQRLARQGRVDERTQERDYVLTWLLAGMAGQPFDLVFKGGTCLRRCYIPGYRYSEDLDFTLPPDSPPIAAVDAASAWCAWIAEQAGIRAEAEQDESLAGRRAWVSFTGPLGATRGRALKVDVATDEVVVGQIEQRPLLSEYSDLASGAYAVPSYSLAEIWAEKTRSVMQRAEPRDLYDLAALAKLSGDVPRAAIELFEAKARAKGLNPEHLGVRLASRELTLRRRWEERLHDQVADVPPFEASWRAVRRALRQAGYLV